MNISCYISWRDNNLHKMYFNRYLCSCLIISRHEHITFVTTNTKSTFLFQLEVHEDKSNKMSSDMQGWYATPPFLSNGDLDSRENAGIPMVPATVHIAPITFATFVFLALNCRGLHMAWYLSYAMKVNVKTLTETLTSCK